MSGRRLILVLWAFSGIMICGCIIIENKNFVVVTFGVETKYVLQVVWFEVYSKLNIFSIP